MSARNFVVGLWTMKAYPDWWWKMKGYPGSMRGHTNEPLLIDGLPFDYEEFNTENKNNVGTKGTCGDPPRS